MQEPQVARRSWPNDRRFSRPAHRIGRPIRLGPVNCHADVVRRLEHGRFQSADVADRAARRHG